jgi:hypothetical protein
MPDLPRWIDRLRGPRVDPGVVVLGQAMAEAAAEQARLDAAGGGASALSGVEYAPGAQEMHRFVESPIDESVSAFVDAYAPLDPRDAAAMRLRLTMHDIYTLLAYARRSVLASMRGRARPTPASGLTAIAAIDPSRVDPRDVISVASLVVWAIDRAGGDHRAALRPAGRACDPDVAALLADLAERRASELLRDGLWRCVEGPEGPALADQDFAPFDLTVDLVAAAYAIQDVVEADRYPVDSITVDTDLPAVWLASSDQPVVQRALGEVRACVSVRGTPSGASQDTSRDPWLSVWLAETRTDDAARTPPRRLRDVSTRRRASRVSGCAAWSSSRRARSARAFRRTRARCADSRSRCDGSSRAR